MKCNNITSLLRQKDESQNGGNKKTEHAKFPEKRTFCLINKNCTTLKKELYRFTLFYISMVIRLVKYILFQCDNISKQVFLKYVNDRKNVPQIAKNHFPNRSFNKENNDFKLSMYNIQVHHRIAHRFLLKYFFLLTNLKPILLLSRSFFLWQVFCSDLTLDIMLSLYLQFYLISY